MALTPFLPSLFSGFFEFAFLNAILGATGRAAGAELLKMAGQPAPYYSLTHDCGGQPLADGRVFQRGVGLGQQFPCQSGLAVLQGGGLFEAPQSEVLGELASMKGVAEPMAVRPVRVCGHAATQPRKEHRLLHLRAALQPLSDGTSLILPHGSTVRAPGHIEPVEETLGAERVSKGRQGASEELKRQIIEVRLPQGWYERRGVLAERVEKRCDVFI